MTLLALDIGEKRCGIAVSDAAHKIAFPLSVLATHEVLSNAPSFRSILQDYEVEAIVCGLPLSLSGEQNQQAFRIRKQAEQIAQQTGLPLSFFDERLSSSEAQRILYESGHTARTMRGKIDMIAASLFLQSYLDSL